MLLNLSLQGLAWGRSMIMAQFAGLSIIGQV